MKNLKKGRDKFRPRETGGDLRGKIIYILKCILLVYRGH
jgi:hypothetical protein